MKIVCFGDSNTYGFDPRSYIGGRYPASSRWPDLLADHTGNEVINAGKNGRTIPVREEGLAWMQEMIAGQDPDLVIVMLGINDLLEGAPVREIVRRMESCLMQLMDLPGIRLILIGPPALGPGTWVPDDQLLQDASDLARQYEGLVDRLEEGGQNAKMDCGQPCQHKTADCRLGFVDASFWDVALTYDGVHFSEQGHQTFARRLATALRERKLL